MSQALASHSHRGLKGSDSLFTSHILQTCSVAHPSPRAHYKGWAVPSCFQLGLSKVGVARRYGARLVWL